MTNWFCIRNTEYLCATIWGSRASKNLKFGKEIFQNFGFFDENDKDEIWRSDPSDIKNNYKCIINGDTYAENSILKKSDNRITDFFAENSKKFKMAF